MLKNNLNKKFLKNTKKWVQQSKYSAHKKHHQASKKKRETKLYALVTYKLQTINTKLKVQHSINKKHKYK